MTGEPDNEHEPTLSERRIERLEGQLAYFQSLAFAALEYAHRQSSELAHDRDEDSPTTEDIRRAVDALRAKRHAEWESRWGPSGGDDPPR